MEPYLLQSALLPSVELASFVGDWYSAEAEATLKVIKEGNNLFLVQRLSIRIPMRPIYKGHFSAQEYVIWATHDARGKINKLHIGGSRMRDMPFVRAR